MTIQPLQTGTVRVKQFQLTGAGLQEGLIYNQFRFVSATQVEDWALFEGETQAEHFFTANYQINGEEISITEEGESFIARLNEDYTG